MRTIRGWIGLCLWAGMLGALGWAADKEDPGIARELGVNSEALERWPDSLYFYESVWWHEPEEFDSHTASADDSLRLLKDHAPQVHLGGSAVDNGDDSIRLGRVFYSYPLHNLYELQGWFTYRGLEGPGMVGYPYVDTVARDYEQDLIYRPGHGLKFTLGVMGNDNPALFFGGLKGGAGYRQKDWQTEIVARYREHWTDPVRVVPWGSARDSVEWDTSWFPPTWDWLPQGGANAVKGFPYVAKEEALILRSRLGWERMYYLEPPGGLDGAVYSGYFFNFGAALKIVCVPKVYLTYDYSWLHGEQEAPYDDLVGLAERRSTHLVGLRLEHDLSRCFSLFATYGIGADPGRDVSFGSLDLQIITAGCTWRLSDMLEFQLGQVYSTETTTGVAADYTETAATMIWRF